LQTSLKETKLKLLEHFIVDSSLADPQVVTGSLCFVTLRLFFPDLSLFIFDALPSSQNLV